VHAGVWGEAAAGPAAADAAAAAVSAADILEIAAAQMRDSEGTVREAAIYLFGAVMRCCGRCPAAATKAAAAAAAAAGWSVGFIADGA
ncbi:hypothetical protein ETH_00037590, partial [Eimeria tenella]